MEFELGQPLEPGMRDRTAQQLPNGFLVDRDPQIAKHCVHGLKIAIDMRIGVRPHRVERAGGKNAVVQHHLGEQGSDFLSIRNIETEMS